MTKDFFMLLLYNRKKMRIAQAFMAGNDYVNCWYIHIIHPLKLYS